MRTKRRFRSRRISKILKTFEIAKALLPLAGLSTETVARNGGLRGSIPFVATGRTHAYSRAVNDNNEGVTRLSAHALIQAFPVDSKGLFSIVYRRRRRDPCLAPPTEVPADVHVTVSSMDDWGGSNPLIVDPHPLAWYGEMLHTPLEVLDMFPGV
ncbi:hypothetical protein Hanom_Chr12g01137011 [Helianthus anomalus]